MKNSLIIIFIIFNLNSIYSQKSDIETIKYFINANQLSFVFQMNEILKNCQFYSPRENSSEYYIDYQTNSLLVDDYWMTTLSLNTARLLFEQESEKLKEVMNSATYDYLIDIFYTLKLPIEANDAKEMMMFQMKFTLIKLKYHGKNSEIEKDFIMVFD